MLNDDEKRRLISLKDYYDDPGVRDLMHQLKSGENDACFEIARALAGSGAVPRGATLIPIPSRSGAAGNNLIICLHLAMLLETKMLPCIIGKPREALYDSKKTPGFVPDEAYFGFRFYGEEPKGPCVLIDGVVDTGATLKAAQSLFTHSVPLLACYAMVGRNALLVPQPAAVPAPVVQEPERSMSYSRR